MGFGTDDLSIWWLHDALVEPGCSSRCSFCGNTATAELQGQLCLNRDQSIARRPEQNKKHKLCECSSCQDSILKCWLFAPKAVEGQQTRSVIRRVFGGSKTVRVENLK